jgi:BirA family biotin operon repressor/biotin-[acetyl-CoA-carboxylase] ligase
MERSFMSNQSLNDSKNSVKDLLSESAIRSYLMTTVPFTFELHATVTSTNELAKRAGEAGRAEGLVIIAEEQTAGKGRLDRRFYSPAGNGIYLSILLRPRIPATEALMITTAAAVAGAEAIEEITGCETKIKWVNDLYCHGGKAAGILTEASFSQDGKLEYAVMGIGLNVHEPQTGFPPEIRNIASAILLSGQQIPEVRNRLAAAFLTRFWNIYRSLPEKNHLDAYRKRSMLIGQQVIVSDTDQIATVLGIDDDCGLIVRWDNGKESTLSSGEVSVKPR